MARTVADVLVDVLEQIGVKQIFALIGDSLNPLADAIRRSHIEWIGVRHEEGAALAAAGQAKFTGQLAVCAGSNFRVHELAGGSQFGRRQGASGAWRGLVRIATHQRKTGARCV